jgi:ankyrin repeat protein
VDVLLKVHSVDVNFGTNEMNTPLQFAAHNRDAVLSKQRPVLSPKMKAGGCQLLSVRTLMNLGADVNKAANDGEMALHLACKAKQNTAEILRLLLPLAIIKLVYAAGRARAPFGYSREVRYQPFNIAINAVNWESLSVLPTRLNPGNFRTNV